MPRSKDIAQWLVEARAGSSEALGKALEECRGYLGKIARQQLNQELKAKGGASDLVQETFLEAQRDFGGFHGHTEREWLAWLRQLLLHNLANFARHFHTAKRQVEHETPLHKKGLSSHVQLGLATPQPSPMDQAIANEQADLLHAALRRMPKDYRQVLVLRYEDGQSFGEISQRTGKSENAVRKLFARAIERMHQELQKTT